VIKIFLWLLASIIVLAALIVGGYCWQARGAHPLDEQRVIIDSLSQEQRCTEPEEIERSLLQQTWFHDEASTRVAGLFGQTSFGLYSGDEQTPVETHGAFCISGKELRVRYYERQHVPISMAFGDPHGITIKFGAKIIPLEPDRISVLELTDRHMLLRFESGGSDRRFYRRR
jgi:hypothetical protein